MIDFKNIINGVTVERVVLIIGGIVGVVGYLYKRRKDRWERRLPILKESWNLLEKMEKVDYFDAKKGPAYILQQNIIIREEGNNKKDRKLSKSCGGPLSWSPADEDVCSKIRDLLRDRFTPDVDLDHIKAKLGKIMDLLDYFAICRSKFNNRWTGGESVEVLEQKYKSKILDEIQTVEHEAALIRKCVIELKTEVENAMRPLWF